MINRNEDAILLSGLSDEALARKVLDYARRTSEQLGVTDRDGGVGETLTRTVPYLASKFGVEVKPEEIASRGKRDLYVFEESRVSDMAKGIMSASMYADQVPGNSLLADPAEGNPVATLLERYMSKIGMPMARDPEGQTRPERWGPATVQSGYVGADAVGTTVIAEHMLRRTAEKGHFPVPYWAPGHTETPDVPKPGSLSARLADRLTPETRLMFLNERAYARRLHALPDKELAAEMLEQARDVRERHGLKVEEQSGYHRFMTWHGIPAMSALFGEQMTKEERSFHDQRTQVSKDHAAARRTEYKPTTDQEHFDGMSSSVVNGFSEGNMYIIENKKGIKPTIAERVMFNEPSNGNSMVMLLDRMAADLGATRGNQYDLAGRRIAERSEGRQEDHAWKPLPIATPESALEKAADKAADKGVTQAPRITPARAAAMSGALGRGI